MRYQFTQTHTQNARVCDRWLVHVHCTRNTTHIHTHAHISSLSRALLYAARHNSTSATVHITSLFSRAGRTSVWSVFCGVCGAVRLDESIRIFVKYVCRQRDWLLICICILCWPFQVGYIHTYIVDMNVFAFSGVILYLNLIKFNLYRKYTL